MSAGPHASNGEPGANGSSVTGGTAAEQEKARARQQAALFQQRLRREVLALRPEERAAALQKVMEEMSALPNWGFQRYETVAGGTAYLGLMANQRTPTGPTFFLLYLSQRGRLFTGSSPPSPESLQTGELPNPDTPLPVDTTLLVPMIRPGHPNDRFDQAARELVDLERRVGWEFINALHGVSSIPRQLKAKVLPVGRGGYAVMDAEGNLLVAYADGTVQRGTTAALEGLAGHPFDSLVGIGQGPEPTPVSVREDHPLREAIPQQSLPDSIERDLTALLANRGIAQGHITPIVNALRRSDDSLDAGYLLQGFSAVPDHDLGRIVGQVNQDLSEGERLSRSLDDVLQPVFYREAVDQAETFAGATLGWESGGGGRDYEWRLDTGQVTNIETARQPRRAGWNRAFISTDRARKRFYIYGAGEQDGTRVTVAELASLIEIESTEANDRPLELQSPHAATPGAKALSPAQRLANRLGVPVVAPETLASGATQWRALVPAIRPEPSGN